jgi:hypothetical protein
MRTETVELAASVGNKTTMAGAGMTGLGWFTSNEFFGLIGAVVALAGLGITWYYKRESNRRQAEESELRKQEIELRMRLMRYGGKPLDGGELELQGEPE